MSNTACDYCGYCSNCFSCDYCVSCFFCDCSSCCSSCDYCFCCDYCRCCSSCKNLKMAEYNYFCWSKEHNNDVSFQQKRYRVFNVFVGEEEYEKIKKIDNRLKFDPNESYTTRHTTAFKKMRDWLTVEQQQEYLDIPHFCWEGFTYITGIKPEDCKKNQTTSLVGKEAMVEIDGKKYKVKVIE